MNGDRFDLIIIGAGPAGLTASIYGSRAGLKVAILEKGLAGGLASTTDLIENYPGFPGGIKGIELGSLMEKQARRFGTEIIHAEVNFVKKSEKGIIVETDKKIYLAPALIIATGTVPKKLNIPGEDEFRGRGVSYCATCDGPLFKGQDIAVIGCGNSGLQEGKFLLNFARTITFVEFLPYMTGDKILQNQFKNEPKAKFFLNYTLERINGKDLIESITIKNRADNTEKTIEVNGVFIYVGLLPSSQFIKGVLALDKDGFIITNENLETSVPGIFAAGDVRSKKIRQVITAGAEGAEAAINVFHYLRLVTV